MKIAQEKLIADLIERTKNNLNKAYKLSELNLETLNWKANPKTWSVLECLEHLNRYGDFYLPEIQNRLKNREAINIDNVFKSGWLGNYFAQSMLPKERLNKMKTFKSMNPLGSQLDQSVINKFIDQQKEMLDILSRANRFDLNKIKTSISISKWIKLKLGDTFRVVIYHNDRHILQANKVIKSFKQQADLVQKNKIS